jgi:hypothetical protein
LTQQKAGLGPAAVFVGTSSPGSWNDNNIDILSGNTGFLGELFNPHPKNLTDAMIKYLEEAGLKMNRFGDWEWDYKKGSTDIS